MAHSRTTDVRMHLMNGAALACIGALAACAPAAVAPAADPTPAAAVARDIHSFARPEEARVTNVDLDLRADFAAKRLAGTAALDVQAAPGARRIVLDSKDLAIQAVTDAAGTPLQWTLGAADTILGRPLEIALPRGTRRIVVRYQTSPTAGALQWLTPAQTAGKRHPYLFSQGQAILTRSWIPTQDSPGIRQTYAARVTVPRELRAVMSAEMLTPDGEAVEGGRAFRFRLDKPVPPYLIALAVGDL
ncbi:MAG TPA: hypothetical protein VK420_17120, partial [Longimicrobium sp.]|nr:hypothetical protein [Longimicrobium sp.]